MLTVISLADGQKPGDVSKILHMEKSTMSRNIERMRKKGWLKVMKGTDGVPPTLMVTAEGDKLLRNIHEDWINVQKKAADFIGNEGIRIIKVLTDNIWSTQKQFYAF